MNKNIGGKTKMSHFAVAVFQEPNGKTLEQLLAPYQENNMGDCPKEYLEFICTEDEYRKEFEEDSVTMVRKPNGNLIYTWDDELAKLKQQIKNDDTQKMQEEYDKLLVSHGYEKVEIMHKDRYPDFDAFMKDWAGYDGKDPETGKYGYWENPNKKWDWWQIGGRYSGLLKLRDSGNVVNSAKIKDIDFEGMTQARIQEYEACWKEAEGKDNATRYFMFGIEKNITLEDYLRKAQMFTTFAVITPDGKWYEKGEMSWWACVSNEEAEWDEKYKERFLDTANPEWTLTIVDCHI